MLIGISKGGQDNEQTTKFQSWRQSYMARM